MDISVRKLIEAADSAVPSHLVTRCCCPVKQHARNNLSIISPLPKPLSEGEGVRCSSHFMHLPKSFGFREQS